MNFPDFRPRRMRSSPLLRNFVQDVSLELKHCVMPVFVRSGEKIKKPISSMPGIFQMSPDIASDFIKSLSLKGITNFLLFGIIDRDEKDETGSISLSDKNPVLQLIQTVRDQGIEALLTADLCLCEYTSHGHCGHLSEDPNITVDNDKTLHLLSEQAVVLAQAGADIIAPSAMMDGMIESIRLYLDQAGKISTPILSYAVKYSSSLYGPFREAAEGAPQFGDRKAYQMDFKRSREWETEIQLDIAEGADMLMVKPGILYLDILKQVREITSLPLGVYHISGEFSMIQAAAEKGWIDKKAAALESLYAFRRAGADFIITYFAQDLSDWLNS